MRTVRLASLLFAVALFSAPVYETADLKPQTLEAFLRYARLTEAEFLAQVNSDQFLRLEIPGQIEKIDEARETVADGGVYITKLETLDEGEKIDVKNGIVHDWYGVVFVEGVTLDDVLTMVKNYDKHDQVFPDVEESGILSDGPPDGDVFDVRYRFRKKKVITVVLETVHHVEYTRLSDTRAYSISRTTKVQEVDGDDVAKEPDTGRGFMWRINSYWRFDERDGGVYIECESISLTRDIPLLLRPLIGPFVNGVPEDTLTDTLEHVRDELVQAPSGDGGDSGPR
ncbi:MAG: hypothetical protein PVJ49_17065 [Acidobacteriota bacterium]|jgi:hypothetical protein